MNQYPLLSSGSAGLPPGWGGRAGRQRFPVFFSTEKMAYKKIEYLRKPVKKLKNWLFLPLGIILDAGKNISFHY
ncbi:hypothetical protein [Compostibacter hankyongensis]|uniref:hypothetical protein n=1 Tax=Compostibacter hankyongensis TaxID=1007089 RepID=UPI0031F07811